LQYDSLDELAPNLKRNTQHATMTVDHDKKAVGNKEGLDFLERLEKMEKELNKVRDFQP
jgi:hypothetical protein